MGIGAPKDLSECRRFFLEPANSKHRMYEALRAYFVDELPSAKVAESFNYSPGSFQVLCHHFRSRLGPSASGFVGPSRAFAWIEDDSRRPRLARLPGSEAVVNGAPQSCDGAGGRRRTGLVCRAECLSQEKLPVRVFLPRFPHPDHSTAGRLA